jgi:hypothetical protein
MKKWKAVAGALAMLMGISGVALAEDGDHRDRDWKNNGAYTYQENYRGDYRAYGYPDYAYNNYYGRDRDHDRDDRGRWNNHDRGHERDWHEQGDRDRR